MKSSTTTILLVAVWGIAGCLADGGSGWNYKRTDHHAGPGAWATNFNECSLTKNSPINIVTKDVISKPAPAWTFTGWNNPHTWTILDTEYTIKYSLSGAAITTSGGDLGDYDMLQFHFHWGSRSSMGSEHTVDDHHYPMEVHFVHKKSQFKTINEAVMSENADALAAVGFFFQIQPEDNPKLKQIIDGVKMVRANANLTVEDFNLNGLTDFTSEATAGNFYRYYGGLTTPACQQIVKWTLFTKPIGISEAQMAVIRDQSVGHYGSELYRDPQPLGNRVVTMYDVECLSAPCSASSFAATTALILFSVISKLL